jgi:hypothetical protein
MRRFLGSASRIKNYQHLEARMQGLAAINTTRSATGCNKSKASSPPLHTTMAAKEEHNAWMTTTRMIA